MDGIDLRNRVVGARLMNENRSPYYYKWRPGDPVTLYDPADYCNINNNLITAPPSWLLLMGPVSKFDYATISYVWIVVEYLFFLLIFLPIYCLLKDKQARTFLLIAGILLLLSDNWNDFVFRGQNHFVLPAIIAISFLLAKRQLRYRYFYIGVILAVLTWFRPNAIVIVPFAFFCTSLNKRHFLAGFASAALLIVTLTIIFHQGQYWLDYYSSAKEWVRNNTSGMLYQRCTFKVDPEKKLVPFAGSLRWQSENEDINTLLQLQFHLIIKPVYYYAIFGIIYISALLLSIKRPAKHLSEALLWGILLYWIAEMTTPISKGSYYYIELFVVVFFLAIKWKDLSLFERLFLALAFLFIFLEPVRMHLYLGELCTIASLALYLYRQKLKHSSLHDIPAQY